jgi:hypothetical protein
MGEIDELFALNDFQRVGKRWAVRVRGVRRRECVQPNRQCSHGRASERHVSLLGDFDDAAIPIVAKLGRSSKEFRELFVWGMTGVLAVL